MRQGPLSETPRFQTVSAADDYPATTGSALRFVPVCAGQLVLGYLWAAVTDDAVGYLPRPAAGRPGLNAAAGWIRRRQWAKANGVRPLRMLRYWAGQPEHATCGYLPEGQEYEAPSLVALREYAAR